MPCSGILTSSPARPASCSRRWRQRIDAPPGLLPPKTWTAGKNAALPAGYSPLRGGTLTELESVVITEQDATLLPPGTDTANADCYMGRQEDGQENSRPDAISP